MQKKYHWIGYLLPPLVVIGGFFAVRFMVQRSFVNEERFGQGNEKVLRSFYDNASLYTSTCDDVLPTSHVIAGITSHHFLAQGLITNFFCGVENIPRHVIIVSPDHFNRFHDQKTIAYVTALSWDTPFGAVANDTALFERIDTLPGVEINNTPFFMEHGVYTLVPFVAKYFSGVEVTSLVVNAKADQEMLSALGKEIRHMADDDTILVVSSDFSHHGDVQTTLSRDEKSLDALAHFSSETVDDIICDCPSCMVFLRGYVGDDRAFVVRDHKNSMDYSGADTDITSYVSGYFVLKDPIFVGKKR
ncbi:MAG: AmmeMemoRadiSam system protein B [Parcubacteria group bacterium]|jgi:AmmeMemoRadiSam system protein B